MLNTKRTKRKLAQIKTRNNKKLKKILVYPPPLKLEDPIQCDDCSASFSNNVEFAFHSLEHSRDRKYTCHMCSYQNCSKYHMEMHIRAHEGTTKYKCEICYKPFTVRTHAVEHKYYHTGEKLFICEICGKKFMFSWRLDAHRKISHYEVLTGR